MSANNAAFSSDDKLVKSLTVTFAWFLAFPASKIPSTSSTRVASPILSLSVWRSPSVKLVNPVTAASASLFASANSLVSSPFSASKPWASLTNSATSSGSVALVMSANNAAFSSDDKLPKPLTVASAFGFWICNCSSFVNALTRLSPLIISVDGLLTVPSGNVNVAVPFFEIVTMVPVGKLLAALIASSTFCFSCCDNSSRLATTIFSGIFTVVFSGTCNNLW